MTSRLDRIRKQHSLPELAEKAGLVLRESGQGFLTTCPFHQDNHPSFSIFAKNDTWYFKCHSGSCGLKGDVIDFVGYSTFGAEWDPSNIPMLKEVTAILKEEGPSADPLPIRNIQYKEVTPNTVYLWKLALYFYKKELEKDTRAKNYLASRKLPEAVIKRWHFGFCPQQGSQFLELGTVTREEEEYAGLVKQGKDYYYEFFHNRIVFADIDGEGNPVALYGRALSKKASNKYLGLAEFKKPVFGITVPFNSSPNVLLFEGAINSMIARHWGYNAIALSGTALTKPTVEIIREGLHGKNLIPVPDNDTAGMTALSKWQELMPWMKSPLFIPSEHKDVNDLLKEEDKAREIFSTKLMKIGA